MDRILIKDLHAHIGESVTIAGWVETRRDHGKITFIDLRDRTGILQTVATPASGEAHTIAREARDEWVVALTGTINKRPERMINADSPTGDIEMEIAAIEVLNKAQELPFDKDAELNLDTLLDYRPLTLRRERERAIFKVQHEIVAGFRDALTAMGFTEFQSPKIVGDDAEGGAGVFRLEYFHDKHAYLATSPQLYKQIMVGALERVFTVGTMFRAEKHATTRHLNELSMLDFEMGFIKDHTDVMRTTTAMLRGITERLRERSVHEFAALSAAIPLIGDMTSDLFPTMKLCEAQELISKETGVNCVGELDLEPEHERWLCEYSKEKLGSDFVFVTHYPVAKRPFYTMPDTEDIGFTKSFDLLFRGVEIVSGAQRIHEYEMLVRNMVLKGLNPEKFSFYLQAFKYGIPPHGGIGMGLERLTQKFLGLANVKEATLFPRDLNRIDTRLSE